jgi:carbon-monoxide dehydrogenase iron sulfur subunit
MQKNPANGVVSVDIEKCVGCWTCVVACPYGALVQDTNKKIVAKCDFCAGQDIPVCVANCPNEALVLSVDGSEAG